MQYKQLKKEIKRVYSPKSSEKDVELIKLYQNNLCSFYERKKSELDVSVLLKRYKVLLNKQRWSGTNAMGLMVGLWSSVLFYGIDEIMKILDTQSTEFAWLSVIVALILFVPFSVIAWTSFMFVSNNFGYALLGNRDIFVETLELELIEKRLQEEGIILSGRRELSIPSDSRVSIRKKRCENTKQILRKRG